MVPDSGHPAANLLTDIRKAAAIALIASVVGALGPVWSSVQKLTDLASANPDLHWLIILTLVAGCVFTATGPLFYFALARNGRDLHFPRRFRLLACVGIGGLGLYEASSLQALLPAIFPRWAGAVAFQPLLAELWNLAPILLLIAIYRRSDDEPDDLSGAAPRDQGGSDREWRVVRFLPAPNDNRAIRLPNYGRIRRTSRATGAMVVGRRCRHPCGRGLTRCSAHCPPEPKNPHRSPGRMGRPTGSRERRARS